MRTTIRLDPQLAAAAKRYALATGRTFTQLVEDALREQLARRQASQTRHRTVKLPTFSGGGLQRGVHLDHSAQLADHMDELA